MIGTVLAVTAAVGGGALAGRGHRRLRETVSGASERRVWFHVHPPHTGLWGEPDPVLVDRDLRTRLQEGLRTTAAPVTAVAPPPRPDGMVQRSYAGLAALGRPAGRFLVGVPTAAAPVMPFAAAGCGLLARRLPRCPDGSRPVTGPVPVAALPGWMVGTDDAGEPVTVNLPPGSTVLLTGAPAGRVVTTVPVTGRVPGQDVAVIDATGNGRGPGDAGGTVEVVGRWRDAWHPQTCRIVVADTAGDAGTGQGLYVDLVVDLDAGELSCRGTRVPFRLLPVR